MTLQDCGFTIEQTGWVRRYRDGTYHMVSSPDTANPPTDANDFVVVGLYNQDGEPIADEFAGRLWYVVLEFANVAP